MNVAGLVRQDPQRPRPRSSRHLIQNDPDGTAPNFAFDEVSADFADWSREVVGPLQWAPSRRLLRAIRIYQQHEKRRGAVGSLMRGYAVAEHRFWSVITGADIPLNSKVGGGLLLPHPNGVVVHPDAVLGSNCLLFQQVTIGHGPRPGVPTIGGHVDIGAGAKVLGGVRIGDHARIGANAVVLDDVPAAKTQWRSGFRRESFLLIGWWHERREQLVPPCR